MGGIMRRALFCAFAVASLATSPSEAKGPYGSIKVGNWSGGAYTNDSGQFSHCVASASYLSGISLFVVVNSQFNWSLGFSHNNWRLQQGDSFPIALTFDGQAPFNVTGRTISNDLVVVPMPDNSALISQFRKSKAMSAFTKGQLFQFKLDATSVLLPSLVNCAKQVNERGIAAVQDFTLKPTAKGPTIPASVPPNVGSSIKPENSQPQSPEYQLEAIELASNFLMKTQLRSARVVSRAETPVEIASYGAAWKSDEASGFIRIVPTSGDTKGLDVAAAVIGNDAKACKGKFASGRMSELVDSDVVFRGFAQCEDSDGSRIAQYFIVPRSKGGFVMFSVQSNMNSEPAKSITKEDSLLDFRKAALVAVSQK
jgi:hypothetical protein